ncbi:uncharacterized protein BJ212DRAFT_1590301 [Suillus subaureus]|uniref:Uncharacterized protein n=1 Tax=Suillus subaureus TaxID=48587 RepID=A0A9P7J8E8_9AGAM|nr:uncharacterized protein BJ212DRAFT_1590301 [Suillus subaureus]KAG1807835.1 hypothetical protein BJ212DRAFT_1590301 [Suillus subaureus]
MSELANSRRRECVTTQGSAHNEAPEWKVRFITFDELVYVGVSCCPQKMSTRYDDYIVAAEEPTLLVVTVGWDASHMIDKRNLDASRKWRKDEGHHDGNAIGKDHGTSDTAQWPVELFHNSMEWEFENRDKDSEVTPANICGCRVGPEEHELHSTRATNWLFPAGKLLEGRRARESEPTSTSTSVYNDTIRVFTSRALRVEPNLLSLLACYDP